MLVALLNCSTPPLMVVAPVYVSVPESVSVPVPVLAIPPAPLIAPLKLPVASPLPIVNVPGWCAEDYVDVCARLDEEEAVGGLELNVSCPNVKNGLSFGTRYRPFSLTALVDECSDGSGMMRRIFPTSVSNR